MEPINLDNIAKPICTMQKATVPEQGIAIGRILVDEEGPPGGVSL